MIPSFQANSATKVSPGGTEAASAVVGPGIQYNVFTPKPTNESMKTALKIITLSLTTFMLPRFICAAYMTLAADHCDPKLGCVGSLQVELLITAIFGLLAGLSLLLVVAYQRRPFYRYWIAASVLLSATYPPFLNSRLLDSSLLTAVAWFLFSLSVYAVTAYLINKSVAKHAAAKQTKATTQLSADEPSAT
jgi:hypothetical protein